MGEVSMTKDKPYRILLWGIGTRYNQMKNIISWYEVTHQFEVVGITAKVLPGFAKLDGYTFVKPFEVSFDYIIVLSDKYFNEIVQNAVSEYGISASKFIKYRILLVPDLNFSDYIKLKESKISIISNNCWGGNCISYTWVGMPFTI